MNITATAHRWEHGWELWLDGEPATQVSRLSKAARQVRDYLDTIDPDTDHREWTITVVPEIGEIGDEVKAARAATEQAAAATKHAATQARAAARHLRAAGYSVADAAVILGVTPGRVSQLVRR